MRLVARLLLLLLAAPAAQALLLAWPAPPRCPAPLLKAAADAGAALLEEIGRDERSLATMASLLAELESAGSPATEKKLKRAVVGDWKLVFVSDESALAPFTATGASGPFVVLEDVYSRWFSDDTVQSIEVVRKVGPFGNVANSLCGRWGARRSSEDETSVLTWRPQYMIDERYREVDPPSTAPREMRVSHVSDELLALRLKEAEESYCIFTRLAKGALKKELDAFSVESEMVMGPKG